MLQYIMSVCACANYLYKDIPITAHWKGNPEEMIGGT